METAIVHWSRQLNDNGKGDDAYRFHNPARSGYKERNQLLEIKKEGGKRLHPQGRRHAIHHPVRGNNCFPNHVKNRQEEQDDIQQLTDGMSRLRIKNKIKKKKIVKLQQKFEASQRKIAILRSYNVELEAGRKL